MASAAGRSLRWRPPITESGEDAPVRRTSYQPQRRTHNPAAERRTDRRMGFRSIVPELPITATRRSDGGRRSCEEREYAAFISYHRAEAGSDARFLQGRLHELLGRPAFTDADATANEDEHGILVNGVKCSEALVLLQTASVLTSPWVLLEICVAVKNNIPLVPVLVTGRGYDYDTAREILRDLPNELERRNPGSLAQLTQQLRRLNAYERLIISVKDVQQLLSDTVPNKIFVHFNPTGTDSQVFAAVRDIHDKLQALQTRTNDGEE
eukprot:640558-Prymnesium_polylepis.1